VFGEHTFLDSDFALPVLKYIEYEQPTDFPRRRVTEKSAFPAAQRRYLRAAKAKRKAIVDCSKDRRYLECAGG
jgi:hypothetical protein